MLKVMSKYLVLVFLILCCFKYINLTNTESIRSDELEGVPKLNETWDEKGIDEDNPSNGYTNDQEVLVRSNDTWERIIPDEEHMSFFGEDNQKLLPQPNNTLDNVTEDISDLNNATDEQDLFARLNEILNKNVTEEKKATLSLAEELEMLKRLDICYEHMVYAMEETYPAIPAPQSQTAENIGHPDKGKCNLNRSTFLFNKNHTYKDKLNLIKRTEQLFTNLKEKFSEDQEKERFLACKKNLKKILSQYLSFNCYKGLCEIYGYGNSGAIATCCRELRKAEMKKFKRSPSFSSLPPDIDYENICESVEFYDGFPDSFYPDTTDENLQVQKSEKNGKDCGSGQGQKMNDENDLSYSGNTDCITNNYVEEDHEFYYIVFMLSILLSLIGFGLL